jgi:uncharacterized damage-inducible protein DinB
MPELTTDFFRQNEWANLAMIRLCQSLTDEQLDATAVGTYGSIRNTLQHIVAAEAGYAFRLERPTGGQGMTLAQFRHLGPTGGRNTRPATAARMSPHADSGRFRR